MSLPGGSAAAATNISIQVAQVSLEKDFDLLQMVLDLLSSVENSKDQKEELTRKVMAFKNKMSQCKELLGKIPGLDMSPEEQDRHYQECLEELHRKRDALEKFKYLDVITATTIKKESS